MIVLSLPNDVLTVLKTGKHLVACGIAEFQNQLVGMFGCIAHNLPTARRVGLAGTCRLIVETEVD